jgi:hypothetical protein
MAEKEQRELEILRKKIAQASLGMALTFCQDMNRRSTSSAVTLQRCAFLYLDFFKPENQLLNRSYIVE